MDIIQKPFLQICLNRGFLTKDEVNEFIDELCTAYDIEIDFSQTDFINHLNAKIKPYNQLLTLYKHPLENNEEFLVFSCTKELPAAKLQKHYTEHEMDYFMNLFETLLRQSSFSISRLDVYEVVNATQQPTTSSQSKKLTKMRMQELINMWKNQGYLLEKDGTLYMGVRMLVEFESKMLAQYEDLLNKCPLCLKLAFYDLNCTACNGMVHRECIRTYLRKKSDCPSCHRPWETPISQRESLN